MLKTRVIPCLLLRNGGLVKTVTFGSPTYVGDPINAVRIFNDKEVDELAFLDIAATPAGRGPDFGLLEHIAREAFMPFGYGGGITHANQIRRLFGMGVEKVILNSAAFTTPDLITEAATMAGSSSVVVSLDVKRRGLKRPTVCIRCGSTDTGRDPVEYAREMARRGAGEILLTAMDRDGTGKGYDLDLVEQVAHAVDIPVAANGGAASLSDFKMAVDRGASAVCAGSMFVFYGPYRAVLITYPAYGDLEALFAS